MVIYLGLMLPAGSSNLPRDTTGRRFLVPAWSCSRWGLQSRAVASTLVSSYLTFPPLPST